jgi:hypothetical protein
MTKIRLAKQRLFVNGIGYTGLCGKPRHLFPKSADIFQGAFSFLC